MRYKASLQLFKSSKKLALISCGLIANVSLFAQAKEEVDTVGKALDEVVVTGQYQAQSLRKSVYKVNVIDQKRIQARSANNAQQILAGELGIIFSNDMALGIADVNIMGVSGMSVKILLDGVPLPDRSEFKESLNQINAQQIERIEIVEGPMSVMYGTDALAGVINIITKKPEDGAIHINAQVTEETAAKEYSPLLGKGLHTQQLSGGWDNGKFNVMASLLHYDFGGFGGNEMDRAHSWRPKEQLLPSLRLGYRAKDWDILYRNDYLLETIVAKGEVSRDNTAKNQFFTTNRMAQQLQYNQKWNNKWFWNNSFGFTDYKRYTKTDLLDYKNQTISLSQEKGEQDTAAFVSINFRSSLLYVHSQKLSIQPGVEFSHDKSTGARIEENVPTIQNYAFFLTAEYKPTAQLSLRPGIRYTNNTLFDAPIIPSLNAMYRLNDNISIRGAYAHGYRAPTLREMYFNFVDANHNILGSTNLKAENSKSFNASFTYRKPLNQNRVYSTELSFFYNNFDNLIAIGQDEEIIKQTKDSTQYHYVNILKNKTTGFALANRFVTPKVEWRIGGLLLGEYNQVSEDAQLGQDYNQFMWSPEFNIEMMYQILATKTRINFLYKYTGRRVRYSTEDNKNGDKEVRMSRRDPFNIFDANIQQQIFPSLRLTIGARNLFNITTVNSTLTSGSVHGSGGSFPFSYGRSYFATLSYNFNNLAKK